MAEEQIEAFEFLLARMALWHTSAVIDKDMFGDVARVTGVPTIFVIANEELRDFLPCLGVKFTRVFYVLKEHLYFDGKRLDLFFVLRGSQA